MSRDFDKAQEMVLASMEYVKILGCRIRRTEVQRDDWKLVAQSHADELIKLRQRVDELKAERDAERKAHDEYKERNREIFNGNQRLTAELAVIKDERDALRAECDSLRRVLSMVRGSLGINQGEHIGNAIDALKKERDDLTTRLRQSIARGDFAEMRLATLTAEMETERERHRQTAAVPQSVDVPRTHPVPCDPPEATHITPDGKATAQAAVKPQPGDVVRLVRVPTNDEYPHDSGRWEPNWGGIGDYMRVHHIGNNINGTRIVRAAFGLEWPISCIEIVEDAK